MHLNLRQTEVILYNSGRSFTNTIHNGRHWITKSEVHSGFLLGNIPIMLLADVITDFNLGNQDGDLGGDNVSATSVATQLTRA